MKHSIDCLDFKPRRKNTLIGFADIFIRELRLVIHDVALHEKHGARWAALPSRPWIKDGALVTDETGKVQYSPILEFDGRETRDAFSVAVWRAVLARHPAEINPEGAS
jgi:hypothetical protein